MRDLEVLETINVRGAHGKIYKIRVRSTSPAGRQLAALKVPAAPNHGFVQEMEIAELLRHYRHPYIIRFLGTGISSEEPFILMDLHEEGDLEDLLRAFGPLPTREALDIVIQVAEAIHFLHGLGVYHRDIKAENIILSESGQPKVMDFGTARVYPRRGGLRIHGAEVGPPARQVDRRRDAAMLGEVLYHTLSGTKLYEARLFALAQRRRLAPAASTRPDRHLQPEVAAQLDAVIRRAIDPAKQHAYPGVRYFLTDLRRLRLLCDRAGPAERLPRSLVEPYPGSTPPFLEQAAAQAWEATLREPENAAPWIHLGNVHLVAMRPAAADRAYAQALRRDPGNVVARLNQAYAAGLLGHWDRALHLAIRAAAEAPQGLHAAARARYVREARHLAQDALSLYSSLDPSQPGNRLRKGYACDALGQHAAAEQEYRQALALTPGFAPAAEALAYLALRQGDTSQALVRARRAVAIGQERAEAWFALGQAHLALDQPDEAAVALSRAVSLDPNHPYVHLDLARAWAALGERERAETDSHYAVTIDPCWTLARITWGDALSCLGHHAEAQIAYSDAVAHNPECLDADGRPGLSFALPSPG
ncbi:MAG: protein kinase [Armatimonadetes bacterium]|nr:protein kinase [Armatimonadota bacterium]